MCIHPNYNIFSFFSGLTALLLPICHVRLRWANANLPFWVSGFRYHTQGCTSVNQIWIHIVKFIFRIKLCCIFHINLKVKLYIKQGCACNLNAKDKSEAKEDIITLLDMRLLNQLSWFIEEDLSSFSWTFSVQLLDACSINSLDKRAFFSF